MMRQLEPHGTTHVIRSSQAAYRGRAELRHVILQEMTQRGYFINDRGKAYYKIHCMPFPVLLDRDDQITRLMLHCFNLTPGEPLFDCILVEVIMYAIQTGKRVGIRRNSLYNPLSNTLYLSNRSQGIVKITLSGIENCPNGTDGILFYEPELIPYPMLRFKEDPQAEEDFRSIILDAVNFSEMPDGQTSDVQRLIFEMWIYALFFPSLFPTKPLLVLTGDKGSGKTFALRQVGRLVCGPAFDVQLSPDNLADFDAAATNLTLIVLDNADSRIPWLEDRLCCCSTGGSITRRKLYTTNEHIISPLIAWIALTSRTPNFRREDVAERCLILSVDRFSEFTPESELQQRFERSHDSIFSGLVMNLQGVLVALADTKDTAYRGTFRMADFASFIRRIGIGRDAGKESEEALSALQHEQQVFTYEEDPLYTLLYELALKNGIVFTEASTSEIFASLCDRIPHRSNSASAIPRSTSSLGRKLTALSHLANCPLQVTYHEAHSRRKLWTIQLREAKAS